MSVADGSSGHCVGKTVAGTTVEPLYSGHCVGRPPAYSSRWIGSQAIQWNLSIVVTV